MTARLAWPLMMRLLTTATVAVAVLVAERMLRGHAVAVNASAALLSGGGHTAGAAATALLALTAIRLAAIVLVPGLAAWVVVVSAWDLIASARRRAAHDPRYGNASAR